ncbi:MAG: carboxypeptidase-like regulatory domain-containing protein [Bacteroidota bacterium]
MILGKRLKITLATLMVMFSAMTVLAQGGTVRGSVVDEDGEPVIGASVVMAEQSTGAATNLDGIFSIPKLQPGTFQIRITYIGMDTVYKQVVVKKNSTTTIAVKMVVSSTQIGTVEIRDERIGKIRKRQFDVGKMRVTARQINLMPSLGTPDLAQYLQVLPGVVFTGDQGGQLYVRGGTPIQNMLLLDGMIVYNPFHSIGLFSIFDTDYIRTVDVYSAAFPAQYGGRVSSIMDIRTKMPSFKGIRGKVNVNPLSSGIMVEGPFKKKTDGTPGGNGFLFSARQSYLDRSSPIVYPYADNQLGGDSIQGFPYSFTDIYGKISLSDGLNGVNFFGLYNRDDVNYEFPSNIGWEQFGIGSKFRFLPAASNVIFTGNFAYSSFSSSLNATSENFPRFSRISGFNGGLRFTYLINSINELNYGITLLGFNTDYSFTNSFGLITSQEFNNTEAAFDFSYKKVFRKVDPTKSDSINDWLVIEPGVHIHYYNDHSRIRLEPRVRAKANFGRVSATFATGSYSQNLISANSDRDVVNLFSGFLAAPTNVPNNIKEHTLQTAVHLLGGVEIELVKNLSTRIEGWYKDFTQLTNINRDKIFPEDPDFIYERGKAGGADLILRYENPKWYIYGTYGWARVIRTDAIRTYAPVFDRRHNANFVIAYYDGDLYAEDAKINGRPKFDEKKWEFSIRWNLGSGFPFTQTQGFFEKIDFLQNGSQTNYVNQNGTLGVLYAEEINGGRLPYYHRLDMSAKRRWVFANRILLEANLSLINLYNRANVFYFDRIRYATINQLPILPSLGLTLKF